MASRRGLAVLLMRVACLAAHQAAGSAGHSKKAWPSLHDLHLGRSSRVRYTTAMSAASKLVYPPPIVYPAKARHTATVIVLHGLGDTGNGWSDFGPQFAEGLGGQAKFVFPTAPIRPITLNNGFQMNGWYDIVSLQKLHAQEDEEGVKESARYVQGLISAEVAAGIPSDRILLAGFSQGGAITMMLLRSSSKLAGFLGLSTYLPLADSGEAVISRVNKDVPILMCHGDADPVVAYEYGRESFQLLEKAGASVTFKTYHGLGHSLHPQELEDIIAFLKSRLPAI